MGRRKGKMISKFLVLATIAVAGIQGTILKRELKTGETSKYEVRCTRTSGPEDGTHDPFTMTASWNAVYTIGNVDSEKGAELTVNVADFKLDTEMEMPGGPPPATRSITATVSSKGAIKQKEPGTPNVTGLGWMGLDYIELPNAEVKVDDTWDMVLPQTLGLGDDVTAKVKLKGEQDFGGQPAWNVTIDAKDLKFASKVKVRIGGPDADEREAKMQGSGNVHVEALIDKTTGRVLSLTQKTHRVQTLDMGDGMEQPPMVIDDVATMKLKKAG